MHVSVLFGQMWIGDFVLPYQNEWGIWRSWLDYVQCPMPCAITGYRLFVAVALIECRKSQVSYVMMSKSAVRKKFAWMADMSGDCLHLFVAAVLIGCWESRVPYEITLLALIGCELELNIYWFLLMTYLLTHLLTYQHNSIVSTCFKEAVDKN